MVAEYRYIYSKSSTHYLSDTNRFDVSSKGPLSRIIVWGVGESTRVFIQVNILKQHVRICLYHLGSE